MHLVGSNDSNTVCEDVELTGFSVLFEDNHLLVIDKPAGIATMGSDAGQETLARQAAEYLKVKYDKPGNAFVGIVSRLDRLASGVLVFARTSKAASRLSAQIRERTVRKSYLACVERNKTAILLPERWLTLEHSLRKNEKMHRMEVVDQGSTGGQVAQLRLRRVFEQNGLSIVEIDLITGRKHQIRVQLAEVGHPVLGDKKYGSNRRFSSGIALHCHRLTISHPTRPEKLTFESRPDRHWKDLPAVFYSQLKTLGADPE